MANRDKEDLHWTTLRDKSELANLKQIRPLTPGQKVYFEAVEKNKVTLVNGIAGTGKSFCACGIAAQMLRSKKIERIILTRPLVSCGEGYGFRPGTVIEKVLPVMVPLIDALGEFLGASQVNKLIEQEVIKLWPLEDMRGASIKNTFIILDEAQNGTYEQLFMFLTRFASGSKVVVCGDVAQSDLRPFGQGGNPFREVMLRLQRIPGIAQVFLTEADIVRDRLTRTIHGRLCNEGGERKEMGESWYKLRCPSCEKSFWVNNGDESDQTGRDVEAARCWSCKKVIIMPEDAGEELRVATVEEEEEYYVDDSFERPG